MDFFVAFKYLHVVLLFFAIALAVSTELVVRRVAGSGDAQAIRTAIASARPLANGSTVLFLAGIAFGIVAGVTGNMDLLAPWLIFSYLAVAGSFAIGMFVLDPWVARLETATAGTPPELAAVVGEPIPRAGSYALMVLIAIIVFMMVVKPFA